MNDWPGWVQQLLRLLAVPLRAPLDPGTLFHWPFLLSALIVALVVYFAFGRAARAKAFFRNYFSASVWWHPSARADYLYYLVNGAFFPIIFAPLLGVSAMVSSGLAGLLAVAGPSAPVSPVAIGAYSVAIFVAYDFGRYLGHVVQHKSAILWEFHKVHHSAQVLTPLTSFRLHPVDLLLMSVTPGLFTGLVGGVAIILSGNAITAWHVLGMHGGVAAYHLISNLRHSHVWFSYGPVLSKYLISPAQHQIHHSAHEKHFHRNMGWAFAVWDRLFGTLYVPVEEETIIYGLGDDSEADYHGLIGMYFLPVVRALMTCVARDVK